MNPLEALMWRAEEDPRLRSTICGLEELDTTPEWDRFLAAHDWGTRLVPRFRQRVVEPLGGIGAPAWVTDPDFDLHYHVRRVRLPEGTGWSELLALAEQIAMTPFDRARALWEAVLFEGLPDGRAAYFLKLHHATTDGLGIVDLLSNLHSRTRESNPDKPQPLPPLPEHRTPVQELAHQLSRDAQRLPGRARARRVVGGARARAAGRHGPQRRALAESLRRVAGESATEGSPLLRGRSMSWRFSAFDVEFAELRARVEGGRRRRSTTRSSPRCWARSAATTRSSAQPIERMPIAVPISVRVEGDTVGRQPDRRGMAGGAGRASPTRSSGCSRSARRCARARGEPAVNAIGARRAAAVLAARTAGLAARRAG